MRTTMRLEDELMMEIKKRAQKENVSCSGEGFRHPSGTEKHAGLIASGCSLWVYQPSIWIR
jgi:hypothetical protein